MDALTRVLEMIETEKMCNYLEQAEQRLDGGDTLHYAAVHDILVKLEKRIEQMIVRISPVEASGG